MEGGREERMDGWKEGGMERGREGEAPECRLVLGKYQG
jgi:hypothetical protein